MMETSAKSFLIWFHLLFRLCCLDSSTMLDFSSLFHLINPKVFCLHMIKFKQGPAVVCMLNLQVFSEILAFPLVPVLMLLKGKSQY